MYSSYRHVAIGVQFLYDIHLRQARSSHRVCISQVCSSHRACISQVYSSYRHAALTGYASHRRAACQELIACEIGTGPLLCQHPFRPTPVRACQDLPSLPHPGVSLCLCVLEDPEDLQLEVDVTRHPQLTAIAHIYPILPYLPVIAACSLAPCRRDRVEVGCCVEAECHFCYPRDALGADFTLLGLRAAKVFILDQKLRCMPRPTDTTELTFRLHGVAWWRRWWTLQDGVFAKDLFPV